MSAAELTQKAADLVHRAAQAAEDAANARNKAARRFNANLATDLAFRSQQYANAARQQARRERATW